MSAEVIPIRPTISDCLAEIKMYQDLLKKCTRELADDQAIIDDTKLRYFEVQNALRVALHKLHVALGLE